MKKVKSVTNLALALCSILWLPSQGKSISDDGLSKVSTIGRTNPEAIWEARGSQEGLQRALDHYQTVVQSDPSNLEALTRLSHGSFLMADVYLEAPMAKRSMFEQAISWGDQAVKTNPAVMEEIREGRELKELISSLQLTGEAEGMFWRTKALLAYSQVQGFGTIVKNKDEIKNSVEYLLINPPFGMYAEVLALHGEILAVLPGFAGGDLDKALSEFQKSFDENPSCLEAYVICAEKYCVKTQDREKFQYLLNFVLESDSNYPAEKAPEQKAAQRKASQLLAKENELFPY